MGLTFQTAIMRGWCIAYCESLRRFYTSGSCLFPIGASSETCLMDHNAIHVVAGRCECHQIFCPGDRDLWLLALCNFSFWTMQLFTLITVSPHLRPAFLRTFQWHILTAAQNPPHQSGSTFSQVPYLGWHSCVYDQGIPGLLEVTPRQKLPPYQALGMSVLAGEAEGSSQLSQAGRSSIDLF